MKRKHGGVSGHLLSFNTPQASYMGCCYETQTWNTLTSMAHACTSTRCSRFSEHRVTSSTSRQQMTIVRENTHCVNECLSSCNTGAGTFLNIFTVRWFRKRRYHSAVAVTVVALTTVTLAAVAVCAVPNQQNTRWYVDRDLSFEIWSFSMLSTFSRSRQDFSFTRSNLVPRNLTGRFRRKFERTLLFWPFADRIFGKHLFVFLYMAN